MNGAGAVLALMLLEWTTGWVAVAAWTQSWTVVKRGHFRIVAWCVVVMAVLTLFAVDSAIEDLSEDASLAWGLTVALAAACGLYLVAQFVRTNLPASIVGAAAGLVGGGAVIALARFIDGWPTVVAALSLLVGATLQGAVTNGMLLGHWYLNQPGLKPWALARLTDLALAATVLSGVAGLVAVGKLTNASTEGAVLGIPGFGESFGVWFYVVWIVLLGFTGAVVWAARRCVKIRSIQSATGLYYVALLTAGVSEFVVRYLMVNAT